MAWVPRDPMQERCPCCGACLHGADHCPCCGCEEYESYCWRICPEPTAPPVEHADHESVTLK
jgi:hypothetical protein